MEDDELSELIARLQAAEGPPRRLVETAHQSRSWADIDAELAELVADSADQLTSASRADEGRHLTFESAGRVLDVDIDGSPSGPAIALSAEPASELRVEHPDGTATTIGDGAVNSATIENPVSGPMRIVVRSESGAWRTGWFTV